MFKKKSASEKSEREKYLQKEKINKIITETFKKYRLLLIVGAVAIVFCFSAWFYGATHPEFINGFKKATDPTKTTLQVEGKTSETTQITDDTKYEPIIYLGKIFQKNNYTKEQIAEIFKQDKQEILEVLKDLGYSLSTDKYDSVANTAEAVFKNETSDQQVTYKITNENREISSEKTFLVENEIDIKKYVTHICDTFDCNYAESNIFDLYMFAKKTPIPEGSSQLQLSGISTIYSRANSKIEYTVTKEFVNGKELINISIKEK